MKTEFNCNAQAVLERVEEFINRPKTRFLLDDRSVFEPLSIFDWWPTWLTKTHLKQMRTFIREAIKLGYTGYVCFKVGARGCANGMWAYVEECTPEGYAPDGPCLYRSFTPAYCYWDVTDKNGKWDYDPQHKYDECKTIKQLEAFIKAHEDVVYCPER